MSEKGYVTLPNNEAKNHYKARICLLAYENHSAEGKLPWEA